LRTQDDSTETENGLDFAFSTEEEGVWDARAASMKLINALTKGPDLLEERMVLRDEFGRRGLNEAIVAFRCVEPPTRLLRELDVYAAAKFADEQDVRDSAHARMAGSSSSVVEQELESLRIRCEELSDEVRASLDNVDFSADWRQRTELRSRLDQQVVEMNALKSLALANPASHSHAKSSEKAGSQVSLCPAFYFLLCLRISRLSISTGWSCV
jgi:hypothetical protein